MGLTDALGEFIAGARFGDLRLPVVEQAKRCVLDAVGCAIAGSGTEAAGRVADLVRHAGGAREAVILGLPAVRVPASAAALANGTAVNALDFDDTLIGHPGATVVPAVLALAEATQSAGPRAIAALVVGYDVCARLHACLMPGGGRFTRVWDTATLQTFGAAAGAAVLLGLPPSQVQSALGIAATTAPLFGVRKRTLQTAHRPMLKSTWGWAAEAGVRAALLAQAGLTGQHDVLDGDLGIWESAPEPALGLAGLTDRLGEIFLIEQVEFKPYPCCRFIHPVLEALHEATRLRRPQPSEVAEVQVESFSLLGDAYHSAVTPTSVSDAQFSTPFCSAAFLVDGELRHDRFTPAGIRDSQVTALAGRVRVTTKGEFERRYPARLGSAVRVIWTSGFQQEGRVTHPRGSPERPLSTEDLTSKYRALSAAMYEAGEAEALAARLLALDEEPDIRRLMDSFAVSHSRLEVR